MCCFCLHFSDYNFIFPENKKKLWFTFEKITCCKEKSQPPWISNGPSLIGKHITFSEKIV